MAENGDKVLEKYPWLVAVRWTLDKVGLPILLILFMLGVWTGYVPSPLTDIAQSMENHLIQSQQQLEVLKDLVKKH